MKNNLKKVGLNIVLTLIFAVAYFYVELPALNFHSGEFYSFLLAILVAYCVISIVLAGRVIVRDKKGIWSYLKTNALFPIIGCVLVIAFTFVSNIVSSPFFHSDAYSNLLEFQKSDFVSDVDEISFDQIPLLDKASAQKLGDRKLGELSDMVSQFEVADDYNQINYKERPVRVTPLQYGDLIKWFNNRSEGIPAYVRIDMVTQNVEVVRLKEGIKYTTSEHFGRNLYRYLRFNYPTYIFDTPKFEIDDNGTPYWVCGKIEKTIGLFGGEDINGAVLVNAITGECTYYENVPNWVDRVYSADLIINQYDYHGSYQGGFWNSIFGQKGVTQTTDGYNYIAMNDDVYVYTGITSVGGDQSNVGFILTNQRTKDTTYYAIAGAEEYSAMSSAEGVVQHLNYSATFPLLLNINSQPTYFMALKDNAGLVKMYAMVNVQQYQVVATGATVAECKTNYSKLLSQNNISTQSDTLLTVRGFIDEINSAVVDGNTVYYIRLEGSLVYYTISADKCETAPTFHLHDDIEISTYVNAESGIYQIVDAQSIELKGSSMLGYTADDLIQ